MGMTIGSVEACAKGTEQNNAKHHGGWHRTPVSKLDLAQFVAPLSSWNSTTFSISLPVHGQHQDSIDKVKPLGAHHKFDDLSNCDMPRNGPDISLNLDKKPIPVAPLTPATPPPEPKLEWSWDIEHADRKLEAKADAALHGAHPFQVDRRVLKDVVREKMGIDVGRIVFLSSGTFHKAYLVTLVDKVELVARVARRFMPRLKTESEVATLQYLRENSTVPVPTVYHYDSNPYNRLGGEYILMSKAPGIPLSKVYHSMGYSDLVKLLQNLAAIVLPLFSHRFSHLGSLYFGPTPHRNTLPSSAATPKAIEHPYSAFPFSPTLSMSNLTSVTTPKLHSKLPSRVSHQFHVGPIISWPFFGSNRGDLTSEEVNRGPWSASQSYFASCADREITGVIRENEGKSAPHRLHLDPDEIHSSRHHHLNAVPGDRSDDSDEYDLEESEEEWEGPGDAMYRDYRRMQRSTFLVAHISRREECVRAEMERWMNLMERLASTTESEGPEEFGLDCHDLSLENVFVDAHDHTKISCIIDWESTTTRPLWACAHLPAFLQSSPFTANLFREAVVKLATAKPASHAPKNSKDFDLASLAREWLHYESAGTQLRMAHRCVEWDGWEEGLVDSILGPEEHEDEWFKETGGTSSGGMHGIASPPLPESSASEDDGAAILVSSLARRKPSSKLPFAKEKEKEQVLDTTGDICGGRGGELGRRLEAWLTVGNTDSVVGRRWKDDEEREYEAEASE